MLSGCISRMQWEHTRRRIHSAWKDQGKFNQEVLFELTLKDGEVDKGLINGTAEERNKAVKTCSPGVNK